MLERRESAVTQLGCRHKHDEVAPWYLARAHREGATEARHLRLKESGAAAYVAAGA